MLKLLEKHPVIVLAATLVIAAVIFYISSLSFPAGDSASGYKSVFYHFLAFFWLSFFLTVLLSRGKSRKLIIIASVICLLYAASDEFHQFFVPGRACSLSDFFIDASGIFLANFIYSLRISKPSKSS